ncbi:MAG TPA: 1-deoxy-D-xylulose-5-phosphate reductoisomerase [bacterium]|nr:1-deoxy-D-xylulose-5-phosphate reductoisomerase [bacterium]
MSARTLLVYGITGSIGTSTLKVVEAFPDRFSIIGCSAGRDRAALDAITPRLPALRRSVCSTDERELRSLLDLAPDLVVMALGGKSGWKITLEALRRGIPVALANKESLVIAGYFLGRATTGDRTKVIPIDSEHAALMQLLRAVRPEHIRKVHLTASGGALLGLSKEEMLEADAATALKHPVWSMGKKVTIDSATMVNKGLELMEAYWLFPVEPEQLGVIIHPEVAVHAAVDLIDGTSLWQAAVSDMAIPIAAALAYPDLLPMLDRFPRFAYPHDRALTFRAPDLDKYPLLALAMDLLRRKDYAGMVAYAIADETAVDAFLAGRIAVRGIHRAVERSVERFRGRTAPLDISALERFIEEIEAGAAQAVRETTP